MSSYKRKEVMDYLTRKPVTQQDFQAALDISSLRPTVSMPVASNESFANEERVGFAKAGLASNETVKAG